MEEYVKSKLNTQIFRKLGSMSGCINKGSVYETDKGKVFLKRNSESEARVMFTGECESLKELLKTQTVKVPEPLLVGNVGKEFFILLEYLDIKSLKKFTSHLGKSLAEMHLHNLKAQKHKKNTEGFVTSDKISVIEKFGFHIPTACGLLPQENKWSEDWVSFYTNQKLQPQVDMIVQSSGNREILELWSQLQLIIPSYFKDVSIKPSLLHGDLWIGNAGETDEEPVVFDPASFYGHHEYDLAIASMFGGFGRQFFESYHSQIPKAGNFQQRHQLYLLFHHLNHWNHFGSHKESSLQIMRNLIKEKTK